MLLVDIAVCKIIVCKIFRLPNNEEKRKIWIDNLQLNQCKLYKGCRVCSQHFGEDMFDRTSACGRVRLKPDAIPYSVIFFECLYLFYLFQNIFRNK